MVGIEGKGHAQQVNDQGYGKADAVAEEIESYVRPREGIILHQRCGSGTDPRAFNQQQESGVDEAAPGNPTDAPAQLLPEDYNRQGS